MSRTSPSLNILTSYPYLKAGQIDALTRMQDVRFLLDSGAFTAWKAGKPIALDDYCRFIESLPFDPWRYFMLDVIGDPAATMRNYEIMLARGFNPIPIFTRGEDFSVLEDYYKTSDVVGIGGLVGTAKHRGYVKAIMSKVGDRKVHWLGFGNHDFVSYYRPYSCDSSTWANGIRFGSIKLYMGGGHSVTLGRKHFKERPAPHIAELIQLYGMDPARFSKASEWINGGRGLNALEEICQKSWVLFSMDVETILGTKYFLVAPSLSHVAQSHRAFHYWRENHVRFKQAFFARSDVWRAGLSRTRRHADK